MLDQKNEPRKIERISHRQARFLSNEAMLEKGGSSRLTLLMITLIAGLIVSAVTMANFMPVVTSAKSVGEIIPVGKNRAVQHLEGGIIQQINVNDGVLVKKNDVLIRFEPTLSVAELDQVKVIAATLQIRARRIKAFIDGTTPAFDDLEDHFSNLVDEALLLLQSTRAHFSSEIAVLKSKINLRRKTVGIFTQRARNLRRQLKLLREAVDMRRKLHTSGHGSRINLISSELELSRTEGLASETEASAKQARAAISEAENQLLELELNARKKAEQELSAVLDELTGVRENFTRLEDRVERLAVMSPVSGIVHGLQFNTPGAVVHPGQILMTIVPIEEGIVAETRLNPRDIGYVRVGQTAKITVAGFDARRYGRISGKLVQLSATTFSDENGAHYFKARIALDQDYVMVDNVRYAVVPGMTIQADIVTGSQNLLRYLTRPVYVALETAFSEQ